MVLMVFYDIKTVTITQKKHAHQFRKRILQSGFKMLQYSIYYKYCDSYSKLYLYESQLPKIVPEDGFIIIFFLTDKQFGEMEVFSSKERLLIDPHQTQLDFF
ncbi:MAG: CRISPR-associated endonuclease Cas2 [Alphaproteobacteria bacterium]|nr:CRISPR-associated endonuclease Cas2 [Alphaproteobacteria bacterium]